MASTKDLVSNNLIHIKLHVALCTYNAPINVFLVRGEWQASPNDLPLQCFDKVMSESLGDALA